MSQSDKDLVKGIKEGEQEAFKVLYLRYADLLFTYILHDLNNQHEIATDIWQETWCIVVEQINSFQFRSSFFTWICAIAKNKIYDYYRQTKKHHQFQSNEKPHFNIDSEEIDMELIDVETQANVVTVLGNLSEDYKFLLTAKYIENKSIGDIALETGKTYKAIESMLTRAREAFRNKFNQANNS